MKRSQGSFQKQEAPTQTQNVRAPITKARTKRTPSSKFTNSRSPPGQAAPPGKSRTAYPGGTYIHGSRCLLQAEYCPCLKQFGSSRGGFFSSSLHDFGMTTPFTHSLKCQHWRGDTRGHTSTHLRCPQMTAERMPLSVQLEARPGKSNAAQAPHELVGFLQHLEALAAHM